MWTFSQSPKGGKTWLLEKKMFPVSLLGDLKINFELVKIFIYFWLWANSILTQCSTRTKVRKKCEFPSILVRKHKLILITQVGTEAVGSDLTLTYFFLLIILIGWGQFYYHYKHFMFNYVYLSFLVTPAFNPPCKKKK